MVPGQAQLRLTWLGTAVETQHDDRERVIDRGLIPIVHDQDLLLSEVRLAFDLGLTRHLALSAMLPVRVINTSIRYLAEDGAEVRLIDPGIHHRDETLSGVGDPTVLLAASLPWAGWRFTARAGLTLPVGRTEEDPFRLGGLDVPHQHIQMGTGTVNPVAALEVVRAVEQWRFGAFALTQQTVYENSKAYQAGDRYAGGAVASRRLGERWTVRGSVEAQAETAERWQGAVQTNDGNRGRFDLLAGAGASWAATSSLALDLGLKVPLVTHAVGGQLEMPAIVELGVSWIFSRPASPASSASRTAPPDDHGHDHGDHDDHDHGDPAPTSPAPVAPLDITGVDLADLGAPGEAKDLVPVPGKLTVFDFRAQWCEPCHQLDPLLLALARQHPGRLAIRRIDIVDWESPAALRYLVPSGLSIPHLKVMDDQSNLLLERTADSRGPQPLVDAIRQLLLAAPPR